MRSKMHVYLPLLLAGIAVPAAAATTFAYALGPSIVTAAYQPPAPDRQGAESQAPDPQTANSPTPPAMPADPSYHGQPYVGALTAPPAAAMNKSYPVCKAGQHDECRNADGQ
jgi:hypothetical protein